MPGALPGTVMLMRGEGVLVEGGAALCPGGGAKDSSAPKYLRRCSTYPCTPLKSDFRPLKPGGWQDPKPNEAEVMVGLLVFPAEADLRRPREMRDSVFLFFLSLPAKACRYAQGSFRSLQLVELEWVVNGEMLTKPGREREREMGRESWIQVVT